MPLLSKRTLCRLAVLVVACAQVFGMQRGYACAHQGKVVETVAEHCHREAGATDTAFAPCLPDSKKDCGDQGEPNHHAPLNVELKASTAGLATVSVPAMVEVLLAEIPVHEWVLMQALAESSMMRTPLDTGGESPPAAVQVARCMVMLV